MMTMRAANRARRAEEGRAGGGWAASHRARLLNGIPVTERRVQLAGISTSFLEGGEGPPVVLLHEQGEFAAQWVRVIPELVRTNRVIAPDLPGHGSSEVGGGLDADRVLAWLGELIEATYTSPPALVGHMGGGAIAARFAVGHGELLSRLVLVDAFGLGRFRPSPRFAAALVRYVTRPSERTYDGLLERCTVDYDGVREGMGERWESFRAYSVDRAQAPSSKAALRVIMRQLALPVIPDDRLTQIEVPTTLIWGRHDPAMWLSIAESASARFGWPLEVIEEAADDPPLEQPEAFLDALRRALDDTRPGQR
jgi:pimeloyl-ACP methyl ester carboxylesterase